MPRLLQDDFETRTTLGDLGAHRSRRLADPSRRRHPRARSVRRQQIRARRPLSVQLRARRDLDLEDFVLDLKVRSTGRDVPQRDVCLILGHQDRSHFYYVHIAKKADPVHNNIFVVDGQPRAPIGESRTEGTPWTNGWHHVRLVRRVDDGLIQVFFDDLINPIMTTHNKRFLHGRVGLGSFDDTAQFDSVQIWENALAREVGGCSRARG